MLAHALKRRCERLKIRDFARHKKLESIDAARISAEIDEPFVNDFGSSLRGDIALKINIQFPCDFEIVSSPSVAHRVKQIITPPRQAIAIRGSACAASRLDFSGFRCIRAKVPTTSQMTHSSVPISINKSFRSGSSQFRPESNIALRRPILRWCPQIAPAAYCRIGGRM